MSRVTQILDAVAQGDPGAANQLLPLVYDELRRLAARKLAHEKPGQTLTATALVHEAYLRLVATPERQASPERERGEGPHWDNRGHFFAAAAEAMRRILVENARRKRGRKHGGGLTRRDADEVQLAAPEPIEDLLALDEALDRLAEKDPLKAQFVKLRYFAGMTIEKAASVLGISAATAKRHWTYTRAWLYQQISGDPAGPPDRPS